MKHHLQQERAHNREYYRTLETEFGKIIIGGDDEVILPPGLWADIQKRLNIEQGIRLF